MVKPTRKIKAIIFDMDGVLVDAKDWHKDALNRALSVFGFSITEDEHRHRYDGLPTRKKLQMLSEEKGLPVGLHSCINALKQKITQEYIYTRLIPFFAHELALSKLKREGYLLAVASNSIVETIDVMMMRAELHKYFSAIVSAEHVSEGKPSPQIYLETMSRLMVRPQECLILEDNEHGKASAYASGGFVLEVESPEDVSYESITSLIRALEGHSA